MNKSETKLKTDKLRLLDAINETKSLRSSLRDEKSDSQQFSESSSQETQRIGNLTFPKWAWTAAWVSDSGRLLMRLGSETIEIIPNGDWDIPQPKSNIAKRYPKQRKDESGLTYHFRLKRHFSIPDLDSPERKEWLATRKWKGTSAGDLLKALREGLDLPAHKWSFVTDNPK